MPKVTHKMDIREKQSLCSKRTAELKKRATKSELHLIKLFNEANIKAMFQKGFIAGDNFCIADFYIPKRKLVIEVDGGYHLTDEQKARDYFKDKYYQQRGFRVIRMTNEEAELHTVQTLLRRIGLG